MRAEVNLRAAMEQLKLCGDQIRLEIIDVFSEPRRALIEGIIVTPTLVVSRDSKTSVIVGDLGNRPQLEALLKMSNAAPRG